MSRTVAPLLSFSASGQIAKTQVYAEWKGRPYVRRYVVPSNPNSAEQQLTRNTFKWLNNVWKYYPTGAIAAWDAYADGFQITARNAFLKVNNGVLRSEVDLGNMILSPAAKGGIVAGGIADTPGSSQLTIDITAPSLPTGWTISKAIAAAIRDQDPQTEAYYSVTAGEDATSTYQVILTGLTPTVQYLYGAWFEYTKPDGTFAYGQSLQDVATPTA